MDKNEHEGVCAHLHVRWITEKAGDGLTRGWWECEFCEMRFAPWTISKPESSDELASIGAVLKLAEQYGYGSLINRLQEAWQAKLQMGGMSVENSKLGSFECNAWEEQGRAQGRIEGLEEAAKIADIEVKTFYEEPLAYAFRDGRNAAAQAIRARIQELKK